MTVNLSAVEPDNMIDTSRSPLSNTVSDKNLSAIGLILIVLVSLVRVAYFVAAVMVEHERVFIELFSVGIALMILPKLQYVKQAAWVGLIGGWFAMLEFGFILPLGPMYAACGYIMATLAAMLLFNDRTWQFILGLSLVGMSGTHLWLLNNVNPFFTRLDVWASWVMQIAFLSLAAAIFSLFFSRVNKMFVEVKEANVQLSAQQRLMHQNSAELEQFNARLKADEMRATHVMNVSLDSFYLLTLDGDIIGANYASCDLLGYSMQELIEMNISDITCGKKSKDALAEFRGSDDEDHILTFRSEHLSADGRTIPVEVRARSIRIDGELAIYATARDISQQIAMREAREEASRELKAKTDLLEIITHNLPARIAYVDRNEALQFYNYAFAEKYAAANQQLPVPISAVLDPGTIQKLTPAIASVMQHGVTVVTEHTEGTVQGGQNFMRHVSVPHIVDGEVVGRVTLAIDVTELRSTEASLEQANSILNHVIDNIPARITYLDAEGVVLYSNRNPENEGSKQTTILGSDGNLRVCERYEGIVASHDKLAFAGRSGVYELRCESSKGKEEEFVEMVRYEPHYEEGRLSGIFSLVTDVTEARQLEVMLQQAQKLESLGVLAGGIAHDFNNLLVGILGQSSLALARLDDELHPSAKHITRAVGAAERAASLTKQMLAYSGRGAFQIEAVDVNVLIQQNLELFSVTLPRNVTLKTSFAEALPLFEADAAQMQQLVMNLIINAGQAIGDQEGCITVETRVAEVSAESDDYWKITGQPLSPGRYTSIIIRDTGRGIAPDAMANIFDPFYTTRESGSGLGLAAVLGIIRGHRGGIRLRSTLGEGTEFHLLFPAVDTVVEIEEKCKSEGKQMGLQEEPVVLIIDDEIEVLEVIADMLELENIATLSADRGVDGIELFRQNRERIGAVLLDLMMPGMSGEETFNALREIDPGVKVILSSGYSEAEATRRFVGNKLADFIQKPYDFQQLTDKVNNVLVNKVGVADPALAD